MTNDELAATLEALVSRAAVLNGTRWQGTWSKGTIYASRDLVFHGGKNYMSLVNGNVSNSPSASRSSKWQEISASVSQNVITGGAQGNLLPTPDGIPQANEDAQIAAGWLPTSLNEAEIFVSPDGDDDNTGDDTYNAKQTIYAGLVALRAAGGGTLRVASGCSVGGPVPGQGIRLRRDFQVGDNNFFAAEGFLPLDVPIRILGCGNDQGNGPFTFAPMTNYTGGGDTPFNPALWILGSGVMKPFTIQNMQNISGGGCGAKIAVDYDRKLDGTIRFLNVTNATRTGTSTVLTVALPTPLTVTHASRTSNVTTLTIPNPGLAYQPWRIGQHILFASGDVRFSSGDKTLTAISNGGNENDNVTWTISYAETDGNVANTAIANSSLQSHNCCEGELLNLVSNNVHFKTSQYITLSATASTITVLDEQGDGDANENNIGTMAHQERLYGHCNMVQIINTSFRVASSFEGVTYHGFDIGSNLAIPLFMKDCWMEGNTGPSLVTRDPRIQASCYIYGGERGGGAVVMERCYGNNGEIFLEDPRGTGYIDAKECLVEQHSFSSELPGIRVWGNSFTRVRIDGFVNADGVAGAPSVELLNMSAPQCLVTRSGRVDGACVGGDNWQEPNAWGSGGNYPTPWQGLNGMRVTSWADGRITGIHPSAVRGAGVLSARFKNIVAAPADWTLPMGDTATEGFPDPFGGNRAIKLDTNGSYVSIFPSGVDGNTWEVGGRFVVSGFFCTVQTFAYNAQCFAVQSSGVTFADRAGILNDPTGAHVLTPYFGKGWQFIQAVMTVATVSDSTPTFTVDLIFGNTAVYLYGLTAYYVPLAVSGGGDTVEISDGDAFEHAGTVKHQPRYLLPGMVGTMEGVKLIADGGIGTNARYTVGEDPGEITLGAANGEAIEIFSRTGVSLGVLPLFGYTVNE